MTDFDWSLTPKKEAAPKQNLNKTVDITYPTNSLPLGDEYWTRKQTQKPVENVKIDLFTYQPPTPRTP